MATKKVRIRKPNEGEQPGFISKLNKYTEKKTEEQEPQYSDKEILSFIKNEIESGSFPEQIISALEKYNVKREKVANTTYELYKQYKAQETASVDPRAPYDRGAPYVEEDQEDEIEEAQDGGQFPSDSIFPKVTKPYYVGMDAEPYDNAYKKGGAISKRSFIRSHIRKLKKAAEGDEVQNSEFYLPPTGSINDPMGKYTQKGKMFAKSVQQVGNEAMYKKQAEEAYNNYMQLGGVMSQQDPHDPLEHLHIYGESLGHELTDTTTGTDNQFQFGGIKKLKGMGGNRRIRRANKALFGTPYGIPGVDVNYEFGALGGLRKATADWDVSVLGDLVKFLPQRGGNIGSPFNTGYSMVSTPARMRDKVIKTVNNQALNEVASNTPGSTATQNNTTGKKKELSCPPGATYDANKGYCVDANGRMVFSPSTMLSQDPSELLTNPFVNPYADQIPGSYQNLKKGQAKTEMLSNAGVQPLQANSGPMSNIAWMGSNARNFKETWTPELLNFDKAAAPYYYPDTNKPWAPFTDQMGLQYNYSNLKGINPKTGLPYEDADNDLILNKQGEDLKNIYRGSAYFQDYFPSSPYSYLLDEDYRKANNINKFEDYTPEQQEQLGARNQNSNLSMDKEGNEYSSMGAAPDYAEQVYNPALNAFNPQVALRDYNDQVMKSLGLTVPGFQSGGFIDSDNPDLYKFIYGGDDIYEEGGYLPKALDGFEQWSQNRFNTGFQPRYNKQREKLSLDPNIMNPFAADGWKQNATQNLLNKSTTTQPTATQPTTTTAQPTTTQPTTTTTNTTQGTNTQQAPGSYNFIAPPSRPGLFGFNRDFNYGSVSSPVNWQTPEGTTGIREVAYKDRGKWYNPFDTKRVREYYAMGAPGTPGQPAGTPGQPAANATQPGSTATQPGTTPSAINETVPKSGRNVSGMTITNVDGNEARGIDSKGRLVSGDFTDDRKRNRQDRRYQRRHGNEDEQQEEGVPNTTSSSSSFPGYLNRPDASQAVSQNPVTFQSPKSVWDPNNIVPNTSASNAPQSNLGPVGMTSSQPVAQPLGSAAGPMTQEQAAQAAFASSANDPMANGQGPRVGATQGITELGSGPTTPEAMSQSNTRLMGNPFADAQQNVFNKQAPRNQFGVIRQEYGGEMDYMPEYMAYGGYIPMGKDGITVDQPEFSDPNYIGKVVEESAFSWNPKQLGADLFAGKGSLTGIASTIGNAIKNEKNFDQYRKQNRSSDAASPNTGQGGFGSAEVVGSNMGDRGWLASNSGRNIQGIGFEGNEVITKKGGQLGSRYKKGSVYTLTAKQIQEIVAAGGKVEYIK
jgi:hypothetical protein